VLKEHRWTQNKLIWIIWSLRHKWGTGTINWQG